MTPLFEAIVEHCPRPPVDPDSPFQMQISTLDYNSFVGAIAVGRIRHGSVKPNQQVVVVKPDGTRRKGKIGLVYGYLGLDRYEVPSASRRATSWPSPASRHPTSPTPCATRTTWRPCRSSASTSRR